MQKLVKEKPIWLKKKIDLYKTQSLHRLFGNLKLNTVCKEALCPNIGECFSKKIATFLIMGNICTRNCSFCAVKKGTPEKIDSNEPMRLKEAVEQLKLKHVVITSVTRDDLEDGGAEVFEEVIKALRTVDYDLKIEVLVPDFNNDSNAIKKVIKAKPDVFAHNLETISKFYDKVRNKASYERSLDVLRKAKNFDGKIYTKSGLMLGLGEKEQEVLKTFVDLRETGCDFLSLGQYLAPSKKHFPVKEFIDPERFNFYKDQALKLGFVHVESGPYVRSSYMSDAYFN